MNEEIPIHSGSNRASLQIVENLDAHHAHDPDTKERQRASQAVLPPSLASVDGELITPEMLTLLDLEQKHIDAIVQSVPGGAKNVQDIYPLSSLQEGILFHRLLNEQSDPYVLSTLFELDSRADVNALQTALQRVIERHDVLRTAILWENLPRPLQVVQRRAVLPLQELTLDPDRIPVEQLKECMRPGAVGLDVRRAPLAQLQVAECTVGEKWYALLRLHHLVCDHQSLQTVVSEVLTCLEESERSLPVPVPYRHYVAHALAQVRLDDSEAFFRETLGDFKEPSAPFGLTDVHGDGGEIEEARRSLDTEVAARARAVARRAGVSAARIFHAAWALVVAHTSGQDDVIFGSVILAGSQRGSQARRSLGMAVNTLPLRLRLRDLTAMGLVEHTHQGLVALLKHEHAPLTLAQRCSGTGGAAPLFTAILNFRHGSGRSAIQQAGTGAVRVVAQGEAWSNYPVALTVDDTRKDFILTAQTDKRIDPRRVIGYLEAAVRSLAEALDHAPQTRALALSILPEEERRQLMCEFNATQMDYQREKLVHELIEARAELRPDATAVVCGNQLLTYAQLNRRANKLAHTLLARGIAPGERVALYMERSTELIVGLLGVLKAGGAYVPLDTSYPADRLAYMLRDSSPIAVLTQKHLTGALPPSDAYVIAVDAENEADGPAGSPGIPLRPSATDLAYVIYTSGSTGAPKGVMVEHRGLLNLVHWHCAAFNVSDGTRSSCIASIGFDAATWEIWPPLCVGGALVVSPPELTGDIEKLIEWWAKETLEVSFLPTPLAEFAFSRNLASGSLRTLLVGGDRLRHRPAAGSFALINNYGPTETTVVATSGRISNDDRTLHIGRAIANTQVYILDRERRPVPMGVAGELYIGGAGVARGYLNRPELTAEQFIPNPFGIEPESRLYKTGDLGRWRDDGTLEYLGRNDHQMKIRGFRIEPGEIETRLVQHPQVRETVIIAREDAPGQKHLVAYVVPCGSSSTPSAPELRSHLQSLLPEYMVPAAFVMVERLPLTSNGKLDRRALPPPERSDYASREYEVPHDGIEQALAQIWQEVLRVERVGRNDNFFELGGHSLLIVQMMQRLRRAGFAAEIRDVFQSPTLADLATSLSRTSVEHPEAPLKVIVPGCEVITPDMLPLIELELEHIDRIVGSVPGGAGNVQDIYPLAPLQEGILFHYLLEQEGGDVYVVPTLLCMSSRARLDELMAALQSVIDRHDILRTALLWEKLPRAVQVVLRRAILPVDEVTLHPDSDPTAQIWEWLKPERQRLDLRHAPLMRLRIAADPRSPRWYALLQLHHIACDATSLGIVISEIAAHIEGRARALPVPVPYRNHVAQALAYARTHDAEAFFRGKFADIDEPTAPFGLLDIQGDGTHIEEARQTLDADLAARVRAQARRLAVSPATIFHAAWALVVAASSGRQDVVFGTVLLGRLQGRSGAQHILGMLINTLPLRLKLQGITVKELVQQTQRELLDLLNHEQASLAVAQRCSGIAPSAPLFTALLNYRHDARVPEKGQFGVEGIEVLAGRGLTNYPVTLSVDDLESGFAVTAQTNRAVDPNRVVGYLQMAIRSTVDALEQTPQLPVRELPVVPIAEREIVDRFNATHKPYAQEKLVHEIFEEQVRLTPDAVAVVHAERSLTYAQLNEKANQLARYLRSKGIGAGGLVGICVERGPEMVITLLGALKAGGAYVPLDPSYSAARLQHMLEDAAPQLVLTQRKLQTALPATQAEVIALESLSQDVTGLRADDLPAVDLGLASSSPVYVIYTSGSTGRPKGTQMPHRAMVNLIEWHRREPDLGVARRVLQFAALSFDVAFQDTFSTLCTGGTLVLLDEWVRRDAKVLVELLQGQSIERIFIPPLMLQSLAEYFSTTGKAARSLKDVIVAGEQLRISPEITRLFKHLEGCRLHNHYGPTETHVVTALTLTGDPEQWPVLPTIGRPIANTQIHILDGQRKPVPLDVPGEIFIGGANVALGYLHRPELSAERFLADPFSADAKLRMYKTGDLGRWREDGTIAYLGRNDDQVKIRGYRIEPGEIEAQLTRHEQVKEAAVVAREDGAGQKRLIAYVVPHDSLNIQETSMASVLREHLQSSLPEYMLPSAFVTLRQLPVTPSGKLDRRALPVPEMYSSPGRDYQAPQGEVEETVARIWRELLQVERVGRDHDFFELGGHSLLVLRSLLKINHALDLSLSVRDVYKSPTVRELATHIAGGSIEDQIVNLSHEAVVPEDIGPHRGHRRTPEQNVLLTGATGFVGRFLLTQLLQDTDARIYCLVRGRSVQEASARLRITLASWDLWREEFEHRIVAVPGDLRMPRLGTDDATYQALCHEVDSIYQCATSMNHLETYAMARAANVDSAIELLRLATRERPKLINYISTLAVFSSYTPGAVRAVDETTPIEQEEHGASSGYVASKWVGEKIFLTAHERGIPCNIFRVGLVWADTQRGRFDELQWVHRLMKSAFLSGFGIRNFTLSMAPTPVDYVTRAIVFLARRRAEGGGIFHISSTDGQVQDLFERCNELADTSLKLLSFHDWIGELKRLHGAGVSLPAVPLMEYAFSMDRKSFERDLRSRPSANIRVDCTSTWRQLEGAGIYAPVLDDRLLELTLLDMLERDAELQWLVEAEGSINSPDPDPSRKRLSYAKR